MDDLISRDALIAQYSHPNELVYTFDIIERIKDAPVVDAAPVVRGEWKNIPCIEENDPRMICSVCRTIDMPMQGWRFCPNCGADMRGDNNGCMD